MLHWLFQELETSESFVQLHILLLHIGLSLLFNQHHLHFFSSKNMEHHGTRWLFSENEVLWTWFLVFLVVPWLPFRCKPPFRKAKSWNLNPSYCQMLWGLFISSVPCPFGSAACEEQCLQCKRQGTIDGSGAAWRCGFVDAAVVTDCLFPASEGNFIFPKIVLFQYFSRLEVSDTWWHTKNGRRYMQYASSLTSYYFPSS